MSNYFVRKSDERGRGNFGWLNAKYTFSFSNYYDPQYMGFSTLRVINQDIVHPGKGFDTHSHKNMEIITYVIKGAVEHQDSMGNKTVIPAGEIQVMSAGSGVSHSEYNPSQSEPLELLQIWILPKENDIKPSYQQMPLNFENSKNQLKLLSISNQILETEKFSDCLGINQNAAIYAALLESNNSLKFSPRFTKKVWLQIVSGELTCNNILLKSGDGFAIEGEDNLIFKSVTNCEFLVFDL